MRFDPQRVQKNVRAATTEDLLDRVTVYRAGMETEAVRLIEAELRERGIYPAAVDAHANRRAAEVLPLPDDTARPCSFCHLPAVAQGRGWHRLWGLVPVFPRFYSYCAVHRPAEWRPANSAGDALTSEDGLRPPS